MDHSTQVALIRRAHALLDAGSTDLSAAPFFNPVATYTCHSQLERERMAFFRQTPLLIGLSSDVPDGSFLTSHEGEVPILLTRSKSGALTALANICRHRGSRVADGAGRSTGRFACPYHGWTYDEAGHLMSQPCREGFEGIAADDLSLQPLPVGERHGLIFVRPSRSDAIDVDAHLAGAERELAPFGLADYIPFAHRTIEPAMNWKLVVDTFLEAYHVPALHDRSLSPMILGSPALWDGFGNNGRLVAVRRSITDIRETPASEWSLLEHSVILYLLFPNTILIYQVDHVEVVQAYPGSSPDSARVVFRLYTPRPVADERERRHFQANFDLLVQTVENEDFRLCQNIQRGFHSGVLDHVVYGRNEPGLAHYHRAVRTAVGDGRA